MKILAVEPLTGEAFDYDYCTKVMRLPFRYGWDHYLIVDPQGRIVSKHERYDDVLTTLGMSSYARTYDEHPAARPPSLPPVWSPSASL